MTAIAAVNRTLTSARRIVCLLVFQGIPQSAQPLHDDGPVFGVGRALQVVDVGLGGRARLAEPLRDFAEATVRRRVARGQCSGSEVGVTRLRKVLGERRPAFRRGEQRVEMLVDGVDDRARRPRRHEGREPADEIDAGHAAFRARDAQLTKIPGSLGRLEEIQELLAAYNSSGARIMHLQRAVEPFDLFVRTVGASSLGVCYALSATDMVLAGIIPSNGARSGGVVLPIARDTMDAIAAAADQIRGMDMLVTTGGASVGDHDLVRPALIAAGASLDFWRVAMRPGKSPCKPLRVVSMRPVPVTGSQAI